MDLNRRQLIRGIGAAICAGRAPPFLAHLVPEAPINALAFADEDGSVFRYKPNCDVMQAFVKWHRDTLSNGQFYSKVERNVQETPILDDNVRGIFAKYDKAKLFI